MSHLLYFLIMGAAMLALARILPGFRVDGWVPAIFAAVVLAVVNVLIKPVLFVLTLPLTIVTLGLFLLVLNAIMLWITSLLVPGFRIEGAMTTFVASLILAVVSMVWKMATDSK